MLHLYEIAKKVRSGEEGAKNENLLTGIFVWVIERYPQFLSNLLNQSTFFGQLDTFNKIISDFEKDDLQLDSMDSSLDGLAEFGRLDAVFKGKNVTLGLENKVVPIAKLKPKNLHDQIERYCQAMEKTERSLKWLILVITPDSESDANKELGPFSKTFSDKVCWISWQKVWDISKHVIESPISRDKKLVLGELKGGLELANLKQFNGFSPQAITAMENLSFLDDEIEEFLISVENLMKDEIGMNKVRISREGNNRYFALDIWPEYIEMDTDDDAIYYGPWFRFGEKIFSVYVEFRGWAEKAHQQWKEKNSGHWNVITLEVEKKWREQDVIFEPLEIGYYLNMPLNHNYLREAKLHDFVKNGIISLKDDIVKPMKLKKT